MALQVIGAGLGRTGTNSLKLALERLLGGPCYHMYELMQNPEHGAHWERAVAGQPVDWDTLFAGYKAGVDWPVCAFWREISVAYPDALVLLSTRKTPEAWWDSMSRTIVPILEAPPLAASAEEQRGMQTIHEMMRTRFTPEWGKPEAAIAAYERQAAEVRATVPPERLIDWQPSQGWGPICEGLGLEVPSEPFPHENRTDDFRDNVEQHMARGRTG